jgi:hydroxymethylpyrimidine pyrophosphatase-like HAD family hydrolase
MELFIGLAIFATGCVVGWKYREHTALKLMQQLQLEEVEEYVENRKIAIKVEKNHGMWFVYKEEDGSFMAQGRSWEEVTDRMAERYPEKRFTIEPDNAKEVGLNL